MALDVKLRQITKLRGKADRFCTITFRGIPATSVVLSGITKDAFFDEDFYWPLETLLDKDEWLEVRLFSRNKIFQDRIVGAYRFSLSSIWHGGCTEIKDHLIDTKHNILQSEILMDVTYTPPQPERAYYDLHVRSDSKSQSVSISQLAADAGISGEEIDADLLENIDDVYHPKIKHPKVVNVESSEWIIQLRIIEARDLAGVSLDPFVCITLGEDIENQKKTNVKKQTNNPEWDELFIFDSVCPAQVILDRILRFEVFTKRGIMSDDDLIGIFKCDVWYIYNQPHGSLFSKFAPLLDGYTTEIKGYLRMDLQVFGKGDVVKDPPPRKEELEIEQNLILPPKINQYRSVHQYQIRVYAAEGIPQMNSSYALVPNVKKIITNKQQDLADPFVQIWFAGVTARTKVEKATYTPQFNQLITFTEFFPPLCKRIKIQLLDSDMSSNEVIGTHFLDLSEFSHSGENNIGGFMPVFGPCWINLYGAPREYGISEEHIELSCGLGEGIAYRGRLLIWLDCIESEPSDTGIVTVEDCDPLPPNILGKEEIFQLFATFYEASMIPRKIGDKPIQFEITMGEYGGFWTKDETKKGSTEEDLDVDEDQLYQQEKVFVYSLTPPLKPVSPEKKYFHVPFGSNKPCTHIKFPFEDQRRRHYNIVLLQKIETILEENLEELDERVRLKSPRICKLLKRVMGEVIHNCTLFIDLVDGKKTGTHMGKNRLDKERDKLCAYVVKQISLVAASIGLTCDEADNVDDKLKKAHNLLTRVKKIIREPQHALPDVFIWMISGNKRVAYTRIQVNDILYSKVPSERGAQAGRVQTIFLRLPGMLGHGQGGWAIQAKIEIRFWLGLLKHKSEYLKDAPCGFETDEDALSTLAVPPPFLRYTEKQKFVVRAHIYQARGLIGSDDSGLSDAFLRCMVTYQPKDTYIIWETRSPSWDMMLKYTDIEMWGDVTEFTVNPPLIILEIFDQDPGGDEEFIGRALAKPIVKLAEERYVGPFFPPALQWFPIYRGEMRAGDVLAAFEMLQIDDTIFTELPVDPEEVDGPDGLIMRVPENVRPAMQQHRVEILFWGVRDIKKVQYMSVNRPVAELDCCYKVKMQTREEAEIVKSVVIKNAKKNPNFHDSVDIFDVYLPEKEKYLPPMTIRVFDIRAFGRKVLCGSNVIETLYTYFMDPTLFEARKPQEDSSKKGDIEDTALDIPVLEEEAVPEAVIKKETKKKDEEADQDEEVLDWWTRFYATLRDMEDVQESKGKNKKLEKSDGAVEAAPLPGAEIPRLTLYMDELEKVEEFGSFMDFMCTFNLLRGKKIDDDEYEDAKHRYAGKFKGNIRVWEYPLPEGFDTEDDMGTFYKLPSHDPINLLVRVYVIRCLNLHPMDPNGKADPYLFCSLGKQHYSFKKEYCSKTLEPQFGKCMEFKAVIPFDYMVRVAIFDWDMLSGDDLIGETYVDIENLYFSKHRPKCGIQKDYITHGYAKWRDPERPTSILTKLCKEFYIDGPYFNTDTVTNEGTCTVGGENYIASAVIKDEKGSETQSDEPCALKALHNFQDLSPKGFHVVPEHVETRPLFNPERSGNPVMGKVQMWIDMFPMDLTMPGEPINVEVRKPVEYELRVIICNTEDVLADETNILTGEASSDIFIKGWLEGNREDIQETDVHYSARDGCGMFNWRFIFPFKFHKAEEKIVTFKKASLFAVDLTEEKHKPLIYFQCWDADLFSSDDFIGDLIMRLTRLPCGAKTAKQCKLDMLEPGKPTVNFFKIKKCKGWWPFQVNLEDDDDPNPILAGKVEAEFDLLLKEDADADPAGKKREEPQPLEKPKRPDRFAFLGPLTMLRYLIWEPCKWNLLKLLLCLLLILLIALFLYTMPGYAIKKLFGA